MKKCVQIAILSVVALSWQACEKEVTHQMTSSKTLQLRNTCGTTAWKLTAGQTLDVGTVTVSNDANSVLVTVSLDDTDYPAACFGNLHLWIGNDLTNLPANKNATPIPGQFCSADGGVCVDASGQKTYTFSIPFADLNIVDAKQACGLTLYVVTHAEVALDCTDQDNGHETAFGGPMAGTGPRWWFHGSYAVCCDFGPPPVPSCQTAFAKGGYVFTTDKKSNPDKLPSLNLTKNRWGWAINLTTPGNTVYDLWAGAGLNKIANGQKAGALKVAWDGTNATIIYELKEGYCLEEVHVYAGDSTPTTIAPGQYGHQAADFIPLNLYSVNIPLSDQDGGGVWLIAHAVVCNQCN